MSAIVSAKSIASSVKVSAPKEALPKLKPQGFSLEKLLGTVDHRQIQQMQKQLIDGKSIAPRKLLLYQIQASRFGLRVEVLSKVAESLTATARKLQQA